MPATAPATDFLNLAALVQSVITIGFGGVLTYYATRYWKRYEANKKAQDEAAAKLASRNEAADAERVALRADITKNKEEHDQFHAANKVTNECLRIQAEKLHTLELALLRNDTRSDARNEATKETMGRIDTQLSMMIQTLRKRA